MPDPVSPAPGRIRRIARLVEFSEIAPDIRHFVFEVPELERFCFVPGQFVSLHARLNRRSIARAYSIASPPARNRFELCLNLVKGGHFSPTLFAMRAGDTITMSGPFGKFYFRQPARDSVLIATGTGIAPFRAMLPVQLPVDPVHRYTLLFGARHENMLLYREEFERLTTMFQNFQFWPTLSRPGAGWTGRTGHVQAHLAEAMGNRRDVDIYLCGLKAMVEEVRGSLDALGFAKEQIIYEPY